MKPELLEQMAMYATALPCPPLPLRLSSLDNHTVQTSHDVLVGLVMAAMVRGNPQLNEERKQLQRRITQTLVERCLASKDASEMYAHCKTFTGEYLHAFDDMGVCTPGICFLDMEDVVPGDKVHMAACSWHAAQDILYAKPEEQRAADVFARLSYAQLINLHWMRMRDVPLDTQV
jgi:hypothetical protein